jgi:hypothetical protein
MQNPLLENVGNVARRASVHVETAALPTVEAKPELATAATAALPTVEAEPEPATAPKKVTQGDR